MQISSQVKKALWLVLTFPGDVNERNNFQSGLSIQIKALLPDCMPVIPSPYHRAVCLGSIELMNEQSKNMSKIYITFDIFR